MIRLWPWLCILFSGVLLTLAYPPFDQSWAIWISLTPLIAAVWFAMRWHRRRWLQLFLYGWTAGSIGFLGNLFWLTSVTIPGWIVLALCLGAYVGLWTLFLGTICQRVLCMSCTYTGSNSAQKGIIWTHSGKNLVAALLAAGAWTGLEWLRGTLFTGFGWNGLGVALWRNTALLQLADITGVGGLSFLIAMVNIVIVITIKRLSVEFGLRPRRPHYDFAFTMMLVALAFLYGINRLTAPFPESTEISIAAIQPNIPQQEKWDSQHEIAILSKYSELTEFAIPLQPDLLIWPEAATPRPAISDEQTREFLNSLAKQWDGNFLLGTMHFDRTGDYNSALLLTHYGKHIQLYHKVHLVPFGEYIPFRHSFPIFVWIMGHLVPGDFNHGTDITILETANPSIKIGPLICFEDTLGDLARHFVLKGAQLFVTVTNDGWFKQSAGSRQHLANAVARCAENKIPMVRAANTGISCIIDSKGRVVDELASNKGDTFIEGVLLGKISIPKIPNHTFYTRYGDLFAIICLVIIAFVGITMGILRIRLRKHEVLDTANTKRPAV